MFTFYIFHFAVLYHGFPASFTLRVNGFQLPSPNSSDLGSSSTDIVFLKSFLLCCYFLSELVLTVLVCLTELVLPALSFLAEYIRTAPVFLTELALTYCTGIFLLNSFLLY